jgi:hypothetical protein
MPDKTQTHVFWFGAVRSLALCSVLAITIPWYLTIIREPRMEKSELLIPLCFAPLWGPFLWVFFRLKFKTG